jgi:hypothetical protein
MEYSLLMRRKHSTASLAGHGLAVNLSLLVLLGLFMIVCVAGAAAGLEGIRKDQPLDFMAPAWFVASALGAVSIALIAIALIVSMVGEILAKRRSAERRRRSLPPRSASADQPQ